MERKELMKILRVDYTNKIRPLLIKDKCEICGTDEELELHHKTQFTLLVDKAIEDLHIVINAMGEEELEKIRNYMLGLQLTNDNITLCKHCHREGHRLNEESNIKIPRRLVYNYNEKTKKVEDSIMNTIEDGGVAMGIILYLDARCYYNGHYALTLEDAMATLGINPTKGKDGTINRVKNVLKSLEENGVLKFYKSIDKIKLDSMIECEITFTFDKEDGEDINWFSIPHGHINKILDEVPSKDIVNCLIVETIVQGKKFNGYSREVDKSSKDKNYPGCAKLSWGYIKPNVTKAIKSKNTWSKYVSILESIGLLYTTIPVVNGEKQSKIYGYSQHEVDWVRKMIEGEPKVEEPKE